MASPFVPVYNHARGHQFTGTTPYWSAWADQAPCMGLQGYMGSGTSTVKFTSDTPYSDRTRCPFRFIADKKAAAYPRTYLYKWKTVVDNDDWHYGFDNLGQLFTHRKLETGNLAAVLTGSASACTFALVDGTPGSADDFRSCMRCLGKTIKATYEYSGRSEHIIERLCMIKTRLGSATSDDLLGHLILQAAAGVAGVIDTDWIDVLFTILGSFGRTHRDLRSAGRPFLNTEIGDLRRIIVFFVAVMCFKGTDIDEALPAARKELFAHVVTARTSGRKGEDVKLVVRSLIEMMFPSCVGISLNELVSRCSNMVTNNKVSRAAMCVSLKRTLDLGDGLTLGPSICDFEKGRVIVSPKRYNNPMTIKTVSPGESKESLVITTGRGKTAHSFAGLAMANVAPGGTIVIEACDFLEGQKFSGMRVFLRDSADTNQISMFGDGATTNGGMGTGRGAPRGGFGKVDMTAFAGSTWQPLAWVRRKQNGDTTVLLAPGWTAGEVVLPPPSGTAAHLVTASRGIRLRVTITPPAPPSPPSPATTTAAGAGAGVGAGAGSGSAGSGATFAELCGSEEKSFAAALAAVAHS